MVISCRHYATTRANVNGTSKDHGGNEIKPAGSDTTSLIIVIIALSVIILVLVLCGIFYIERKRKTGNYFI